MIFLVTTLKDTLSNVRRFVAGNLANGIDHIVVCLDAPNAEGQREVGEFLDGHPHVTAIRCDDDWWAGRRPEALSARQRTNANVVKAALSPFPWAEWLFHLDGDEVALLDRDVMAAVPRSETTVKLRPLESLARESPDGEPTEFKRLLSDDELALLHGLGVIRRPSQGLYFHGHTSGKSGLRPSMDHWLFVHSTEDANRAKLPQYTHPSLRHLHYESFSGEEFARKWTNLVTSGTTPVFRGTRKGVAAAVNGLLGLSLPPEATHRYLLRIFRSQIEDDADVLADLGLLENVDPLLGDHRPEPLPAGDHRMLASVLDGIRSQPKAPYVRPASRDKARALLAQALR
jgi:hypothetical protein